MRTIIPVVAALAFSFVGAVTSAKASDFDKRTDFKVNEPINVEGTILPAGNYYFKIPVHPRTIDVVEIWNADTNRLVTMAETTRVHRTRATYHPRVIFSEAAPGQPMVLREWFYVNQYSGLGFFAPPQASSKAVAMNTSPVNQQ